MTDHKIPQAVRGMNDILPHETPYWQLLENACRETAAAFGYQEVRFPIVEHTALFQRAVGAMTDIVEKEMYEFLDKNGDSLCLRPEGTAACVRCLLQGGALHNQVQRVWYLGPMFRHERPQLGRYRQFHQWGAEAFGFCGIAIEVELICMTRQLWQRLGLLDQVQLEINTLGSLDDRQRHRTALIAYFMQHQDQLDADSQRRLQHNPLRLLDSKNPAMQTLIHAAPALTDFLSHDSQVHFEGLQDRLKKLEIPFRINPRLVRGLDYYNHTVFEWTTTALGAQGSVCGGGRYDGLLEQLGGPPTRAVGFSVGLERILALLQQQKTLAFLLDVYWILADDTAEQVALLLAEKIRAKLPVLRMLMNFQGGSLKTQFKRADKSGARLAFVIAEREVIDQTIVVKQLRGVDQNDQHNTQTNQQTLPVTELISWLEEHVSEWI